MTTFHTDKPHTWVPNQDPDKYKPFSAPLVCFYCAVTTFQVDMLQYSNECREYPFMDPAEALEEELRHYRSELEYYRSKEPPVDAPFIRGQISAICAAIDIVKGDKKFFKKVE